MLSSKPIAVFDTGVGGLSVVSALKSLLPNEDIHYFADTAHLPYGPKSPELIKFLSLQMAKRLIELSSCKVLVVACHTVSVWCLDEIQKHTKIPVIGMVEPSINGLRLLIKARAIFSVGILSTKATLISNAYRNAWPLIDPTQTIHLIEHAAGPLVSLVEECDFSEKALRIVLEQILPDSLKTCDALLIGCTHFSALTQVLKSITKSDCQIVDAAYFAADAVHNFLKGSHLLSDKTGQGELISFVTDNHQRFANVAQRFIDEEFKIHLVEDLGLI